MHTQLVTPSDFGVSAVRSVTNVPKLVTQT